MPALFPYERYATLAGSQTVYYPAGEEKLARWVEQTLAQASTRLEALFARPVPEFEVLIVDMADWEQVPHSGSEELNSPHPYMTDVTNPPSLVIPTEIDPILGEVTEEKLAFMLYHELVVAFLEDDSRPWPENAPLWADEWQFKFVALWLSHRLNAIRDVVNADVHNEYTEVFEPEPDGKTPVTIRGFDWYEDTTAEDYLVYQLLLERFAADLLARYDINVLLRYLDLYRVEGTTDLLSDDVTRLLIEALGADSADWLEALVYF